MGTIMSMKSCGYVCLGKARTYRKIFDIRLCYSPKRVVSFYLQVVYGIVGEFGGFYGDSCDSSKWFFMVLFMRKRMEALDA